MSAAREYTLLIGDAVTMSILACKQKNFVDVCMFYPTDMQAVS